jgi:site-specific DNA recombinase
MPTDVALPFRAPSKIRNELGPLPLGYQMKDGKIAIVEDEAERVRLIFLRYLDLGGVNALVRDLRERNIRSKTRLLATGATRGGVLFGRGSLF